MYFNVFRHRKRADIDMEAYLADAGRMEALARVQRGFIAYRRYSAEDGESLSISEWKSEQDAIVWAENIEHGSVQERARQEYYESYVVYSCPDPHVRRFNRREP